MQLKFKKERFLNVNNTESLKNTDLDEVVEQSANTTVDLDTEKNQIDDLPDESEKPSKGLKAFLAKFNEKVSKIKWLSFLIFPCTILYMEFVFKLITTPKFFNWGLVILPLYSLFAGGLLYFLCSSFSPKVNNILAKVLLIAMTVLFASQIVYYWCFNKYYILYSIGVGGADQIIEKGIIEKTIGTIKACFLPIIITSIPAIFSLFLISKKRVIFQKIQIKKRLIGLASTIGVRVLASILVLIIPATKEIYYGAFDMNVNASYFGLLNTEVKDVWYNIFEFDQPSTIQVHDVPASTTPNGETLETWQMNIDFDELIKNETDDEVLDLHKYFRNRTPTEKNEYTGMFEGYNLIYVTAEGFSQYAIHKDLTPTLYKMYNKGFKFNNFYTPIWGVSTFDGEYVNCTGLIPKSGVWSLFRAGDLQNDMRFTMGRQFLNAGVPKVYAYHGHTYKYYRRDISHPNMGYEYKAIGNGLEDKIEKCWPESDLELMEASADEYISSTDRFHAYYMTVSGHLDYNFKDNSMSVKNQKLVENLNMSETAKAYIACNIELDKAMELLLSKLEKAGVADKTLIVISPDHYPYGLEDKSSDDEYHYFSELAGHAIEPKFEIYKSSLIMYSPSMIEPIEIDKYCSSLDVLPTISNLLNMEYDSRLIMGKDILSTSSPLVVFSDKSFINERGMYNAIDRTFTDFEGNPIEDEDYLLECKTEVNNMFLASAGILDNDYYGIVFGTRKTRIN